MANHQKTDVRLGAALLAAKLTTTGVRRLGRGGTAAPGLIADRIDPNLLPKLAARLDRGAVFVAGTNGKTTVSRMLADILTADGAHVVHNRSGSNLVRGVAAAFAEQATLRGNPRGNVAVIEADEAAFPDLLRRVSPRVVLLNNLFRDQLDRYGELHTIARKWQAALKALPSSATIVVNVDDPLLASIVADVTAHVVTFGLDDPNPAIQLKELPHAADTATCRACGAPLTYDALYVGHLGAWRCANCGNKRPTLDVAGRAVRLTGVESLSIDVEWAGPAAETATFSVGVPGLYNAYNALAAAAVARACDVPTSTIQRALGAFRAAFGRIERATLNGRTLTLALVKNPTGFNEVLRMLTASQTSDTGEPLLTIPTLIAINDLDADGRDVSWLWDVDFELLAAGDVPLATAGIRGADMANRLKYAGVEPSRIRQLSTDLPTALEQFVASLSEGGSGYILPTYTAMLAIRQALVARGAVESFWKQ